MNTTKGTLNSADPFAIGVPFRLPDRFFNQRGEKVIYRTVERFPPEAEGKPAIWSKRYFAGLESFNKRENELMLCIAGDEVPFVAKYLKIERDGSPLANPQATQQSVAVTTADAGLDLEQWIGIKPIGEGFTSTPDHPFQHPRAFLALALQVLLALREFHARGYVHLDLHTKNICIPYAPYPFNRVGRVTMQLHALRLIDFGYSVNAKRLPLRKLAIPLHPDAPPCHQLKRGKRVWVKDPSAYMAPSLRKALRIGVGSPEGIRATIEALENLDWTVDLFSLGYLLGELRDDVLSVTSEREPLFGVVETLPDVLMKFDRDAGPADSGARPEMPHDRLIGEIADRLGFATPTDLEGLQKQVIDLQQHILCFEVEQYQATPEEREQEGLLKVPPVVSRSRYVPSVAIAILVALIGVTIWRYDELADMVGIRRSGTETVATHGTSREASTAQGACKFCPPTESLGNDLRLAVRQATYAEFDACFASGQCTARPVRAAGESPEQPARNISAQDGEQLAKWLSLSGDRKWRLASLESLDAVRASGDSARWGRIGTESGEIAGDCAPDSPRSSDGECIFRMALGGPGLVDGGGESPRHWLLATARSSAYGVRLMEDRRR